MAKIDTDYSNFIVFDIEATDRNCKTCEVIEIAALKIKHGQIIDTFNTLVKPSCSIPYDVIKLTGITNEMVEGAPCIKEVLPTFLKFIDGQLLIGHNISTYDLHVLNRYTSLLNGQSISNYYIDTLYLSRKAFPDLPSHALSKLVEYCNIDSTIFHRALADVETTHKLFTIIKNKYPDLIVAKQFNAPEPANSKTHTKKYTDTTKALQTLQGFLLGITADNVLLDSEVLSLKTWLENHSDLAGQYPFDRVFKVIQQALADEILEQSELDEMLILFKQFSDPTDEFSISTESIQISEAKQICLSGEFIHGSKSEIQDLVTNIGWTYKNSVSSKTDYLIVGELGNDNWACGNYGTKIKKALELQNKGCKIQIIKESDFFNMIENANFHSESGSTQEESFEKFDFYKEFQDLIDEIILSHDLPTNSIHLYSNTSSKGKNAGTETSKSLCIFEPEYPPRPGMTEKAGKNFIIFNIKENKDNSVELLIRNKQFDEIDLPASATIKTVKSDINFRHVVFSKNDCSILTFIKDNILYCLANYESSSSFGCCSRFIECSDAKQCVHANKVYSMGCKYRKHLNAGRIFYGKNKNI